MKNVYPQLPSSSVPPVHGTRTNESMTSDVVPPTSPTDNVPPPAPASLDKCDTETSSKLKGKFKPRRSRSTSPAEGSESDVDFDKLDVHSDEERQRASKGEAEPRSVFPDPSSPSSPSLYIIQRKGGMGDAGRVKLGDGKWVTNYEYGRLQKMAQNKTLMRAMGIPDAVKTLVGTKKPSPHIAARSSRTPVSNPARPRIKTERKVVVSFLLLFFYIYTN